MRAARNMPTITDLDAAWLAGLLEGEGSFVVRYPNRSHRRPYIAVSLSMTDRDVVERAHSLMGTPSVRLKPRQSERWLQQYTTTANGRCAEAVMRRVRPFMGQRRGDKIDSILAMPSLSHHD